MSEKDKQITISYLEEARENWLIAKASAERAGYMSSALNNLEGQCMEIVDGLLDELIELGGLAVRATEIK